MDQRIEELLEHIKRLENELSRELQKKEEEFFYRVRGRKVCFEKEIKREHRRLKKRLHHYLFESRLANIATVPFIWACLPPALVLDLLVSLYHLICFPIYNIPKVSRADYLVVDRHALRYLNLIEKINCVYCGYFNGLIAYVQEVAARTEQYWCPIKHARKMTRLHSRYRKFIAYGDAEGFQKRLETIRKDFDDLD